VHRLDQAQWLLGCSGGVAATPLNYQSRAMYRLISSARNALSSVIVRTTPVLACLVVPLLLHAQTPLDDVPAPDEAVLPASPISNDRILGVIPNFQTVSDPTTPYVPLRVRDKWRLFVRDSVDPFSFFSAAAGAGISQWHNEDPKYGAGFVPYLQRFGAAQADLTSQNFFQDAVLAPLFREDPRYFRRGPGSTVLHRIAYAVSRAVITRRDSGKDGFNFSGIVGMELGIALSSAYYPAKSVNGEELAYRTFTSFTASALGNLLPEFWPDIKARLDKARFDRHKHQ
jgi:hypothetical protein